MPVPSINNAGGRYMPEGPGRTDRVALIRRYRREPVPSQTVAVRLTPPDPAPETRHTAEETHRLRLLIIDLAADLREAREFAHECRADYDGLAEAVVAAWDEAEGQGAELRALRLTVLGLVLISFGFLTLYAAAWVG